LDGKYINADGSAGSNYSCGRCHTTGHDPAGHQQNHLGVEMAGATGTWALDGIQCEACHGPGATMAVPTVKECSECHTGGDAALRLQFDKTNHYFSASHSQGDEFAHSPHKDQTCVSCHDPHKSVWFEDGGVRYSEAEGPGNMCTRCHDKRIRGSMGEIGLECVDCHMPVASMKGSGATHLFRINATALAANDNTFQADGKTWWNTDQNGDASLTLDLVCADCHRNMTLSQMAKAAKAVHRQPGLVDLTVNGGDSLQMVKKADVVSVNFSVDAGAEAGLDGQTADWWVLRQTKRGWSYWNGKKWKSGMRPWRKKTAIADVENQNVFRSKLTPGYYTYWVSILPSDGSEYSDSVPVYVTKR